VGHLEVGRRETEGIRKKVRLMKRDLFLVVEEMALSVIAKRIHIE
jgi:hypothetical protein